LIELSHSGSSIRRPCSFDCIAGRKDQLKIERQIPKPHQRFA
jgi:hypothetical protein